MTSANELRKQVVAECETCNATGLYNGYAEKSGTTVVCSKCRGTGRMVITYMPFLMRRDKQNVKKVYATNPGYNIHENMSGGMPYAEWKKNPKKIYEPENAVQEHACPEQWSQNTGYQMKSHNWEECSIVDTFAKCKFYSTKEMCWKRYIAERDLRFSKVKQKKGTS